MADDIDFNFEWSLKNNGGNIQVPPTPTPVINLFYESLSANMLKTRIAGKSFSLFLGTSEVAIFEIENINSIDILGSNITIHFGNKTNTVLKFIDTSESVLAESRIEVMLNGGTIS